MRKVLKWALGFASLSYGSWLQVESHGSAVQFVIGSFLVLMAFGLIIGWRWTGTKRGSGQ